MRYRDILTENVIKLDLDDLNEEVIRVEMADQRLIVMHNPAAAQVKALLDRSKQHEVRGFCYENDIFFWDAFYANHGEMFDKLLQEHGFEFNDMNKKLSWFILAEHEPKPPFFEITGARPPPLFQKIIDQLGYKVLG